MTTPPDMSAYRTTRGMPFEKRIVIDRAALQSAWEGFCERTDVKDRLAFALAFELAVRDYLEACDTDPEERERKWLLDQDPGSHAEWASPDRIRRDRRREREEDELNR